MKPTIEILLVDDNTGDSELTADLLRRSGQLINIHSVDDGAEAMSYLLREGKYSEMIPPHLMMLDLNMPRKDGHAVLLAREIGQHTQKYNRRDIHHVGRPS